MDNCLSIKHLFLSTKNNKMKIRNFLVSFALLFSLSGAMMGQSFDLNSQIPKDKETIRGVLPNGMTYFIRHNAEPKDRASFYMIQNVGALLENDNQNGLAHFLEHMAFNGTKHFPGKGIIKTLEKHGVSFGGNINAYTAKNETVYNISDVPTKQKSLLDTCLLVLNDWSNYLLLDKDEIDSERGVISEEWRTRRTASFRLRTQIAPFLYKGSKYAERDVIGDLNIIKTFKPKTIKSFYHDWYRTDLQAIAIVGDFDVKDMEAKVKALFSKIPAVKNAKKRPIFQIPENKELIFKLATDKEAQQSGISLYIKHKNTDLNTLAELKDSYVHSFYNAMLGSRISELLQKGTPPFISASSGIGGLVRGYSCYSVSATANPSKEAEALEAVYTEVERIKQHGFHQSELDRIKIGMKASLESSYKQRNKIHNDSYCKAYKSEYTVNSVCTSSEFDYQFGLYVVETMTLEDVNKVASKWITKENRVVTITGPDKDVKHIGIKEVKEVLARVEAKKLTPYVDAASGKKLISEELKGGKVVATKELKDFSATEWTLSNNVKVVYRFADFDKDAVSLSSWSEGGTSLYDNKDIVSAGSAGSFIGAYGVGDFSATSLRKVLAGKNVSVSPYISGLTEGIRGGCSPKDFETMLKLVYLYFEHPRFDVEAHNALISRNRAAIKNMATNPQKILKDSIKMIFSNYNPRVHLFNNKYLDEIDINKIEEVYKERISDASDFTFVIVGNIPKDKVKLMVEKYIGSLTDIDRKETWKDRTYPKQKGKTVKVLYSPMETPKGTVIVKYSKAAKYNSHNRICQSIVGSILDLRYTENIREKEGGTYGVSVSPSVSRIPNEKLGMTISFNCDPDKADHLKSLVYKEIDTFIKEGPTQDELDKIIKSIKKNSEQGKNHNSYWMSALTTLYYSGENVLSSSYMDDVLDDLTVKDIRKAAKRFFKKADIMDVTILPQK